MSKTPRITNAVPTTAMFGNGKSVYRTVTVRERKGCSLGARCKPLKRVIRILEILKECGEKGATYDNLCRLTKVSWKTINRDVAALRECRYVIDRQSGGRGSLVKFILRGGPLL